MSRNCVDHPWELSYWGVRRLVYLSTISHPSLVEAGSWGINHPASWAAPCMDQWCCRGWPLLSSTEKEEATACMGTSEGAAGRLRRGECMPPASGLLHSLPLQWQTFASLRIFLLRQVLQGFSPNWKSHYSPRNFEFGKFWQEVGKLCQRLRLFSQGMISWKNYLFLKETNQLDFSWLEKS